PNASENASEANRFVASLKYAQKVPTIIRLADRVIVGNDHLAAYARAHNPAVTVIPTCVDTSRFVPRASGPNGGLPVVGWIGSPTTTPYLTGVGDVLRAAHQHHPFVLRVSGAEEGFQIPGVNVREERWA